MTVVEPNLSGDWEGRRAFRGLVLLALGNLFVVAVLTAVTFATSELGFSRIAYIRVLGFNANLAQAAVIGGQWDSLAVLLALLPSRRFAGLLGTIVFALAVGAILWVGFVMRLPESAHQFLNLLWAGLLSLGVFAIAQGLRLFGGQRLVLQEKAELASGARFGTADLIEWTVTIGVFFGIGKLVGWFQSPVQLASTVGLSMLVTLPLALAIVSRSRRRWMWISVAIGLAFSATLVRNLAMWHYLDPNMFRMPKWMLISYNITIPACTLLATAINFSIVRRLGFRWGGATEPAAGKA